MFHTSARMIMSGIAAIALGAMSGWVIIDRMPKKAQEAPARAAAVVVPDTRTTAAEPTAPSPPAAKPSAPAAPPAAATPPPRIAAPANPPPAVVEPDKDPAAKPAASSPGKPQIRLDPGRGEGSVEIGDAGVSADKKGRIRIKGPDLGFSFDPEEGEFRVRTPKGSFGIDW
ncbi:MAG: hypothetical protein AB7O44_03145 [Hyphomicrobiaceae bacterium]